MKRLAVAIFLLTSLTACQQTGRYTQHQDSAPDFRYPAHSMEDAQPKYEPYRSHNSKPYVVLGKRYTPLQSGKGYVAQGNASWYGQKFHGHLTSNGETYDMFAMTAAHKTLPLPSYVKVTNLENNKQAIVRVNDRGPFHSNRIIDLSYAAAKKLGYQQHGTARVKLEVIHVDENDLVTVGNAPAVPYAQYAGLAPAPSESDTPEGVYIQVAAISDLARAQAISTGLASLYQVQAEIPLVNNVYRLRLGPLSDRFQVAQLLEELKSNGYPGAFTVTLTSDG